MTLAIAQGADLILALAVGATSAACGLAAWVGQRRAER